MKNRNVIGINTLFMIPAFVGGTEQHLRAALSSLEKQDKTNRYVVFCNNENFDTFQFRNPLWKKIRCPVNAASRPLRILYEQCVLPLLVKREKCTIIHSFGYFGPVFCPVQHIITIHDCNWRDYPKDFGCIERLTLKILIELNITRCDAIMSVSEFTKQRLIHYFPSAEGKILVIPSAISDVFLDEAKKQHIHPLAGKPYLLCVSGMYPHKKIPYLLDLWKEITKDDKHLHLVLIGKNGKDEKKVRETAGELLRFHYFPNLSLSTLVSFYQHAGACIFPSVYEGFGYPVYEALYVGKTVFVGKKELYLESIQENVYELSFDIRKDIAFIFSTVRSLKGNKGRAVSMHPYDESMKKLIHIYDAN